MFAGRPRKNIDGLTAEQIELRAKNRAWAALYRARKRGDGEVVGHLQTGEAPDQIKTKIVPFGPLKNRPRAIVGTMHAAEKPDFFSEETLADRYLRALMKRDAKYWRAHVRQQYFGDDGEKGDAALVARHTESSLTTSWYAAHGRPRPRPEYYAAERSREGMARLRARRRQAADG